MKTYLNKKVPRFTPTSNVRHMF